MERFTHPQSATTNYRLLVFLTAAATLMFELVAARLADFHLGAGNAYLAIPITFLGLALGSLHVHIRPRIVERFRPVVALAVLAGLCYAAVLIVFVVFSKLLPVLSIFEITSNRLYMLYKTMTFIGVLLPPFYYFGRILTVAYQIKRQEIGAVYSADFWGAALGSALTPLLFHFGGLPNVSLLLLGLTFLPVVVFFRGRMVPRLLIAAALVGACLVGAHVITLVDDSLDYTRYNRNLEITELTHAWNEFSRVALLDRGSGRFGIVHDNSRSSVHVRAYRPQSVGRPPRKLDGLEAPVLLGRPVREVLVLYAGCGAEMISLNELLGGRAHITGVELNPLVRELAVGAHRLERFRLQEFYDLPQIDLVIDDGRHFLSATSKKFDLVFIGSNAATGVWMTGHSRKYLDTTEAFDLMLDRLSDDGIIVFDYQPLERRIETLKSVLRERGIQDFGRRVVVFHSRVWADDMIVSPSGFRDHELRALVRAAGQNQMRYVPRGARNDGRYTGLIEGPVSVEDTMTDDRPFLVGLDWKGYRPFPTERYAKDYLLYLSWIKITTLIVLVLISAAFLAATALRRSSNLPPSVLIYLLVTGFCFMLVEIALIAKLELFLQKPIVSMATVLSTFLLASGLGSRLFPRVERRLRIGPLAVVVAGLVVASIFVLNSLGTHGMGLPVAVRVLVAVVVMAPLGIALGMFYPYAVSCLVRRGRPEAVAVSYGISTLSSVIGATYAMTVMLDLGFSSLLWQAAAGYVVLALYVLLYALMWKGRYLDLGLSLD